jgi:hypothetical protein
LKLVHGTSLWWLQEPPRQMRKASRETKAEYP